PAFHLLGFDRRKSFACLLQLRAARFELCLLLSERFSQARCLRLEFGLALLGLFVLACELPKLALELDALGARALERELILVDLRLETGGLLAQVAQLIVECAEFSLARLEPCAR